MSLLNNYFYVFKYLTSWVALLVVFHTYTYNVFNLLLLTLLVCVGGFYISFVYPKYYTYQFASLQIKINTIMERCALEFLVHFALLLYVFKTYRCKYNIVSYQTLNSIMLILAYFIMIDVRTMYNLRTMDIACIASTYFMVVLLTLFI